MKSALDRILEGEDIKAVLSEATVVDEAKYKDIEDASNMVSDWLKANTYNYDITGRETQHKIKFKEYGPDGAVETEDYFIVRSDGHLYNSNGDDVVALSLDAYDNDPEKVAEIKAFKSKWYK